MMFGFVRTIFLAVVFACIGFGYSSAASELFIGEHDVNLIVHDSKALSFYLSEGVLEDTEIRFDIQHPDLLTVSPPAIYIKKDDAKTEYQITLEGQAAGHCIVAANVTTNSSSLDVSNAFVRVTVQYYTSLNYLSFIIGWVYFIAWSISFYPQIYQNWKRKSVVGLNFDFIALNLLGFTLYGIFNVGLYYIPEIEEMYFARHPRGTNPVQLNDVFFAIHAAFATLITIVQCYIYESGNQRVSYTAGSLIGLFFLIIITILGMSLYQYITWLDFLYYCATIKLTITLIKYIPQAYMNYKRKSTIGWSIGNVLLDFTGGILSMGQMIINAYNFDDWASIFGDPTKFGLGLFSVIFDIFFICQHYVLYRNQAYEEIPGGDEDNDVPEVQE